MKPQNCRLSPRSAPPAVPPTSGDVGRKAEGVRVRRDGERRGDDADDERRLRAERAARGFPRTARSSPSVRFIATHDAIEAVPGKEAQERVARSSSASSRRRWGSSGGATGRSPRRTREGRGGRVSGSNADFSRSAGVRSRLAVLRVATPHAPARGTPRAHHEPRSRRARASPSARSPRSSRACRAAAKGAE